MSYVLNILTPTTPLGFSFGFKGLSLIHRLYWGTLPWESFGSAHNTSPVIVTMGPAAPVVITCEMFRRMSVTTPGGIVEMFIAMVLHSLTGSGEPCPLRARICVRVTESRGNVIYNNRSGAIIEHSDYWLYVHHQDNFLPHAHTIALECLFGQQWVEFHA